MFAFSFCVSANKKKRDISFENEEGLKGNAKELFRFEAGTGVCQVTLVDLLHMACKEAALLEARERSDSRPHARGCYPLAFSFCDSAKKEKAGHKF